MNVVDGIMEHLEETAKTKACFDDSEFMIDDYAGGNIDDAYSIGYDDGMISLARELLKKFFNREVTHKEE